MRLFILAMVTGGFILTGCSLNENLVDIHGEDKQVFFPEGEIEVRLVEHSAGQPDWNYAAISAGYAHSEGQFKQTLSAGETVSIDGTYIDGPTTLDNDASLAVGYLRATYHSLSNEAFEWYAGAGLGLINMDFTTMTNSERRTISDNQPSMNVLFGLGYHFSPVVGIDGNIGLYLPAFGFFDSASLYEQQLRLTVTPSESVQLFAGYRQWSYDNEMNDTLFERSAISFDFAGPTAGVTLRF